MDEHRDLLRICNLRKGNKLPEEVEMVPRKKPTRPSGFYVLLLNLGIKTLPDYWKDYMFLEGLI